MTSLIKRSLAAQIATILTVSFLVGVVAFALLYHQQAQTIGGLSILLALWFSLRHLIIQPILELQKLARKIGSEENRTDIDLSNRRDEIGSLSRTLLVTEKEVKRQQQ